jgi:hypothetical protein
MIERRTDALIITTAPIFSRYRERFVELAERHALPAVYFSREFALAGGLQCLTLLTSRAREGFTNIEARAQPISPSLRRPLCVRRGSQGLRNQNRPLSHTTRRPVDTKFSALDFGAYVEPTRGRRWGVCPNEQRSLVPAPRRSIQREHREHRIRIRCPLWSLCQ